MILLHIRSFYLLQQFKKTKNEIERSNHLLEEQLREFVRDVEMKNQELVAEVEGYLVHVQKPDRPTVETTTKEVVAPVAEVPVQKKSAPKKKPTQPRSSHVAASYQQNALPANDATDELELIRLYDKQGKSVSEIATLVGRAESEVNLLLFMARKESTR